jgi:hypothetical protein
MFDMGDIEVTMVDLSVHFKHYNMKMYGGVHLYTQVSLTSALVGGGQLHAPAVLHPGGGVLKLI